MVAGRKVAVLIVPRNICCIAHAYFLLDLYGKPYGVNYIARYSLCKRIGSTFAHNVVGTVYVGADLASIFGAVQAVPSPYPLPAKDVLFLIVGCVGRDEVQIKKAGLTGITLFSDFHRYAHERGFVGEHINEPCMRYLYEVLIVALPHAAFLLPERILPDNDRSYPVFYQEVNDTLAGCVQVVIDAPVTGVGDAFHLAGHALSVCFRKLFL
jgi:hypothetical protein